MQTYVPRKYIKPHDQLPWITRTNKTLIKKRNKAYCTMKHQPTPDNISKFKSLKRKAKHSIRHSYEQYLTDIVNPTVDHGNKKLWSLIRAKRRDTTGVTPLKENGELVQQPLDKANVLNRQFNSAFSPITTEHLPDIGESPYPQMQNITVTVPDVEKLLLNLKPNKAAGPDAILPRTLKDFATVTSKANKALGFVKRNIHSSSELLKTRAYQAIVRPSLEYATCVWDPHTQIAKQKLEAVQRRAARYVTRRYHNTSSVTNMLRHLEWQTLEQRKIATNLTMLYKITNNIVTVPIHTYLTPWTRHPTRSHNLCYMPYQCNTHTLKYSFFPRTIILLNSLPSYIASAPTLNLFKDAVFTWTNTTTAAAVYNCTDAHQHDLVPQLFWAHRCVITCIII